MKLKIVRYDERQDFHVCKEEGGGTRLLDLFTDDSFKDTTHPPKEKMDVEYMKSLEGKYIEVESTSPYVQCYFAENVKFTTKNHRQDKVV